jgi:hypothetical protein
MKTTKSLVWACLAVLALTFASTAFAEHGNNGTRSSGTGGGDGLGWLRNMMRVVADLIPPATSSWTPSLNHEQPHQ